jgi:hypothetical protein
VSITFGEWRGASFAKGSRSSPGAFASCEVFTDRGVGGLLKQYGPGKFVFERLSHGDVRRLRARKRHTAQLEVVSILTEISSTQ